MDERMLCSSICSMDGMRAILMDSRASDAGSFNLKNPELLIARTGQGIY